MFLPSSDHLFAVVRVSEDAIVSTDRDGIVTSWNPAAEQMSGFAACEVLGRPVGFVVPAEGAGQEREVIGRVLAEDRTARMETWWRRPDGTSLQVELTIAPTRSGDEVTGASIIVRDRTARHRSFQQLRESEERTRLVIETAPDPFVAIDEDGLIVGWNRASERTFGWSTEEAVGRSLASTIIPDDLRDRHEAGFRRFAASGESPLAGRPLELTAKHRNGHEFPVELTLAPMRTGGRLVVNAFIRDLSGRDAAQLAQSRLATIVHSSDDAIMSSDSHGRITSWNPAAQRLLGYTADQVIGAPVAMLVPPERIAEVADLQRRVRDGERVQQLETERRHRDGRLVEVALTISQLTDDAGSVVGTSVIARDVGPRRRAERAERAAQEERLRRASLDDLTGLATRGAFLESVGRMLALGGPVAVGVVDVSRFHELNDALGRDIGDRLLQGVARSLGAALPLGTLLARLEADVFAVMLELDPAQACPLLADAVQAALAPGLDLDDLALSVEASTGFAAHPGDGHTAELLLTNAERALRAAKQTRTGFERYERERDGVNAASLPIVAELERGLDRGELVMHFQPQLDLRTGAIVSAEALMRWQHPTRGLLPPGAFLPHVEQAGLMRRLTVEAIDQALAACRAWGEQGLDLPVAVNLSVLNLLDLEIAHHVARLLGRHGVPADRLRLEITEDTLMVDPERAGGVLAGLDAMGIELAIDDFGTGYSSLAYLHRLPVSELKIDRCFAGDLEAGANRAIVSSVIDLGRNLGLRIVAEGMEDAETLTALAELGCDLAQGYVVGRPMPPADLAALARSYSGREAGAQADLDVPAQRV